MSSPYVQGATHAFQKFAVDADLWKHVAELGGLGLLSIPVAHHLLTSKDDKERLLAGTELAGLGALTAPTLHSLWTHRA